MVVPVLITNCQVLEKLKTGPVITHAMITANAIMKAVELPVALVTLAENFSNNTENLFLTFITMNLKMNCL